MAIATTPAGPLRLPSLGVMYDLQYVICDLQVPGQWLRSALLLGRTGNGMPMVAASGTAVSLD